MSQSPATVVLVEQSLLEQVGEDVRDRLVERTGLRLVDETGGVLGDRVGELVTEDVDRLGERSKILPSPSPKTSCAPFQNALS